MLDTILANLEWLGHDSFCLHAAGKVIYFDPFQVSGNLDPADIILISHDHFDHCSPEDVTKIQQDSTTIVTEPESAKKLTGTVKSLQPGDSITVDNIKIEAVPAYNTNKKFHPQSNNWIGFIVTIEGVRIYHAGDTDHIPEMKNFDTDIALLPVSGTYVMTAEEAATAALDIKPQVAIPMHFGAIVGEKSDAEHFSEKLEGKIKVIIPQKR
ncbi:MAG: MBL fold metallo-hydrolase [Desulfobulbaceae bacterium]|nr:MBL fold metallo-hydrolase [Desulfobulbaceae bacterium]